MNAKKNITNETIVITQHPDYKAEIVEILRSKLTPKLMRERILAYHENDIAAAVELLSWKLACISITQVPSEHQKMRTPKGIRIFESSDLF